MQNLAYAHPYVRDVSVVNGQLALKVEVTNFIDTGGEVEITGVATQGGAVANISAFADIASATSTDGAPENERFVTVMADIFSKDTFSPEDEITITVRVSKVWVTVLGPLFGQESPGAAPAWGGNPMAVTQIGGKPQPWGG